MEGLNFSDASEQQYGYLDRHAGERLFIALMLATVSVQTHFPAARATTSQ